MECGTLRVGTALNIPWAMRTNDGELFGFEVDNASKLATELSGDLDLVEMPFAELIPSLQEGEIDVIAAGMSVTPGRALEVAFSTPYMTSTVGAVVRVSDLSDRPDVIAFNDADVTIAAAAGTTTEIAAIQARRTGLSHVFE